MKEPGEYFDRFSRHEPARHQDLGRLIQGHDGGDACR
jgi:hypothetical protein